MSESGEDQRSSWPALPYAEWRETCQTLYLWTQIVGKVRLACTPWIDHSWHVTQYVTARGLTTSLIPHGSSAFQVDFDFVDHALRISRDDGRSARMDLYPRSVADFYAEFMKRLDDLGLPVRIHPIPSELVDPVPFPEDHVHASYDPAYVRRFWSGARADCCRIQ